MSRAAVPTHFFALVAVRLGRRLLLVHETKHAQQWYLPAGRVEPGESLTAAALRETREEAGIEIVLEGVLRIEHTSTPDGSARVRVFFLARPADDAPPKSFADQHSLEARWVSPEELDALALRGDDVRSVFGHLTSGATVSPLSILASGEAAW